MTNLTSCIRRTCRSARLVAATVAISLAASVAAPAADLIDPKALDALQRMSDTVGKAETIRFSAYTLFDDLEKSGVKYKRGIFQEITVQRPNRLHFRSAGDPGWVREGWYDGKTFTVAMPAEKTYAQIDAPPELDALLDLLQEEYGVFMPTIDILYTDLIGRLRDHLLSGVYVGRKTVDGTALHHVSFEMTPADVQHWIEHDGAPVPRRSVVNYVTLDGAPEHLTVYRDWVLGEFVNDGEFQFTASADWKQIEMPKP